MMNNAWNVAAVMGQHMPEAQLAIAICEARGTPPFAYNSSRCVLQWQAVVAEFLIADELRARLAAMPIQF